MVVALVSYTRYALSLIPATCAAARDARSARSPYGIRPPRLDRLAKRSAIRRRLASARLGALEQKQPGGCDREHDEQDEDRRDAARRPELHHLLRAPELLAELLRRERRERRGHRGRSRGRRGCHGRRDARVASRGRGARVDVIPRGGAGWFDHGRYDVEWDACRASRG